MTEELPQQEEDREKAAASQEPNQLDRDSKTEETEERDALIYGRSRTIGAIESSFRRAVVGQEAIVESGRAQLREAAKKLKEAAVAFEKTRSFLEVIK